MNNKLKIVSLTIITIVVAGVLWFVINPVKPKTENVTIRVLESTEPTQWELAKKLTGRDILAEEGVTLESIRSVQSGGGTVALQALLADNVDTASSAWPTWINIIARGGKIKALLGTIVSTKDNRSGNSGLLVLEESNIRTYKGSCW